MTLAIIGCVILAVGVIGFLSSVGSDAPSRDMAGGMFLVMVIVGFVLIISYNPTYDVKIEMGKPEDQIQHHSETQGQLKIIQREKFTL